METYITICNIDSQCEFAVSGNSNGLFFILEEWDGEGDERGVQEEGRADSC